MSRVAITAVPARAENVAVIEAAHKAAGHEVQVFWDPDRNGPLWNTARAWAWGADDSEGWLVTIQDDQTWVPGAPEALDRILSFAPAPMVHLFDVHHTHCAQRSPRSPWAFCDWGPGWAVALRGWVARKLFEEYEANPNVPFFHDDVFRAIVANVNCWPRAVIRCGIYRDIPGTVSTLKHPPQNPLSVALTNISQWADLDSDWWVKPDLVCATLDYGLAARDVMLNRLRQYREGQWH